MGGLGAVRDKADESALIVPEARGVRYDPFGPAAAAKETWRETGRTDLTGLHKSKQGKSRKVKVRVKVRFLPFLGLLYIPAERTFTFTFLQHVLLESYFYFYFSLPLRYAPLL